MGTYTLPLVGESQYQDAIRCASPGDGVRLAHESGNAHDSRAIRVDDITGRPIGYVPRDSWFTSAMFDQGVDVAAEIKAIEGGDGARPMLGVVLTVYTAQDARARLATPSPASAPPAMGQIVEHRALPRYVAPAPPDSWMDRTLDRLFMPKARGRDGRIRVDAGPNSFQSCAGCVGWLVLLLILLIVAGSIRGS